MWLRALLAGAFLAGLLSACAVVDPIDRRYDTIGRSWAQARNEAIFLNLIRASYNDPLSFTTVSNVTPTMTNTSSFALPSFSIGPPNCLPTISATRTITCTYGTGFGGAATALGSSTAANSTAVSSNFSISTEETSSFYNGFLKPIDLQTLNYFIRQGYPLELLFWLFADSFELQRGQPSYAPNNAYRYQYNPPDSYGCPRHDLSHMCFREWVWVALLSGLTVEEKTIVTKTSTKYETAPVARFCFNYQLGLKAANEMPPEFAAYIQRKYMHFSRPPSPVCGTWDDKEAEALLTNPQPDNFKFSVAGVTFRVVPRSAYGVFKFLGQLIEIQRDNIAPTEKAFLWPNAEPGETDVPPLLKTVDGTPPLITIIPPGDSPCFVHTWYLNSDFCISEADTTSKNIMSLLAQLIAIQTQATDLSITPLVRVIQ